MKLSTKLAFVIFVIACGMILAGIITAYAKQENPLKSLYNRHDTVSLGNCYNHNPFQYHNLDKVFCGQESGKGKSDKNHDGKPVITIVQENPNTTVTDDSPTGNNDNPTDNNGGNNGNNGNGNPGNDKDKGKAGEKCDKGMCENTDGKTGEHGNSKKD